MTNVSYGRRTYLKAATSGAIALTGVTGIGTVAASDGADNMLVLIYDDGHLEDYTEALPLHQEFDAPGCVAACPGLIGTDERWLTREQLDEIYDAGWEIMSHSIEHRALGEIPIQSDAIAGDTHIHVQSHRHGQFPGDPLLIFDNTSEVTATVEGIATENGESYLVLEEPLEEDVLVAEDPWVRYTDEFTEWVLEESRDQLESWGYPVTAYVHPYNRYDGFVSEVLPEYYDAVPNAGRAPSQIPISNVDPYHIGRATFETDRMTDEEVTAFIDAIAEDEVFGVLYGHTGYDTLPPERIEHTLEVAADRDVSVVTLQEALVELDILQEMPQPPDVQSENAGNDTDSDAHGEDESTDDTSDPPPDDSDNSDDDTSKQNPEDDSLPGLGAAMAAGSIGGALLYRRFTHDETESEHILQ